MGNPQVFISYSHDSPAHSERVLALAWALRNHGIDVELDQFHNEEIVDWPRWCREQIRRDRSDFVLCICTAEYQRRIDGHVPPEKGKGVYWEGALLDAAWQIAESDYTKLFLADIHLHRARLFRDKEELERAHALIEHCGYWRRKQELEDAEEAAKFW